MRFALPIALVAASLAAPIAAVDVIEQPTAGPVKVQLDGIPTGQLVTILMRDIMRVPYVIAPEVLADRKPMSVNLVMPRSELPVRVVRFLRSVGLTVKLEGGTVYVSRVGAAAFAYGAPSGSPLAAPMESAAVPVGAAMGAPAPSYAPVAPSVSEARAFAVISPAHRSVLELAQTLGSLMPGLDVSARATTEPQGTEIRGTFDPDTLSIGGTSTDVDRAVQLVRALDKPRPQVEIHAVLFEVRNTERQGSALSVLAKLAGFEVEASGGALPGSQFLRFASGGVSAILSATKGDSRFKVVAEPRLAALSGSVASINAGSQVPTVGSVTYTEDGAPIRSVEYRDSGVSLSVRPLVRGGEIELTVMQERSSFARTTTGVDDSPTLNRSTSSAQVSLLPGETVVLAGLDEKSEGNGREGFLGGLFATRTRDNSASQLLVLLQADLVPSRAHRETAVLILPAHGDT